MKSSLSVVLVLLLSSIASAQFLTAVEADSIKNQRTVETTSVVMPDGSKLPEVETSNVSKQIGETKVVVVQLSAMAGGDFGPPSIEFEEFATGLDAEDKFKKVNPTTWVATESGRYRVRAYAVNKTTYGIESQKITIDVEGGEAPADVDNRYGVGAVAYSAAIATPMELKAAAKVYREAANSLFGTPVIRTVSPATNSNSVFRFIQTEIGRLNNQDWKQWRVELDRAFYLSQTNRQFSRQDWYAALNEVAEALELKSN